MKSREVTPFGVSVKKKLIDKRMSQVELADALGVKKQYLSLIFSGARSGEKYRNRIIEILELERAG
jgi:transcriptional regulator with XRE-family HTH domain